MIGRVLIVAICFLGSILSFITASNNISIDKVTGTEYKVDLSNYGWLSIGFLLTAIVCIKMI